MSEPINVDLQSSMLLETLRQTPSIPEHQDGGGGGGSGPSAACLVEGAAKGTSSSTSSFDHGQDGGGGGCSELEKSELEAMDPAILSSTAPSGSEIPGIPKEKSSRLRYSSEQLLGLRGVELSRRSPPCIKGSMPDKRAKMFQSVLKPVLSPANEDELSGGGSGGNTGGGNGANNSGGNYGKNRGGNGSGAGDGPGSGSNNTVNGNSRNEGPSRRMDLRDPKDRLRKEDGIVLSPQRRNFNMGCQMPAAPTSGSSSLNIGGGLLRNERDILGGGRERRIGSGRILSRDVSWDYRPDKEVIESNDFRASNNLGFRERERENREPRETRDTRDSRRPLNREYDRNENESRSSRMSSRYGSSYNDSHGGGGGGGSNHHSKSYSNNHYHSSHHDRRRLYSDNRDEEPEWFSEPTSQNDTIELRGFDDPVPEEDCRSEKDNVEDTKHDLLEHSKRPEKDSKRPSSSIQNDKNNNSDGSDLFAGSNQQSSEKLNANHLSLAPGGDTIHLDRTPGDGASDGSSAKSAIGPVGSNSSGMPKVLGQSKITDDDFNFEDFLKLDELPSNLLLPELPNKDTGSTGGSRFSQWFRQENTPQSQGQQQQTQLQQPQQQQQLHHPQQKQQPPGSHFDNSRRSSLQDEINNMINDFTSAGLDEHIPDSNSNKYFAPISPAASTSSNSLLELFQRSDKQHQQQQQQQQRDREHHHQQQQHQQMHSHGPASGGHPHGHPLLGHPPNHPGLHHQQQQQHHQQIQNRSLQQLLGVSGSGANHGPMAPIPVAPNVGQIHSVEELEARFRQNDDANTRGVSVGGGSGAANANVPSIPRLITPSSGGSGGGGLPSNVEQQQDMNAFKKLLAQITDNQHGGQHSHNAQPGPPGPHPSHHQAHPVNMLHHQQQQNELLQKMLHLNQMHHSGTDARQAEILKRPEAQALLHGVARGEVSQHNLWQQLANPGTAQPHREILTSVLNTFNTSPRVVSPNILIQPSPGGVPILPQATVPPAAAAVAAAAANNASLLFQHHSKQQMRLSPLPNGIPQRIPSPRELQFHTQSIMQNALIRKKLEEQRENYRKRQEQQQQQQQQQNRNQSETSSASSSVASGNTITTTSNSGTIGAASSASQQQTGGPPPTNSIRDNPSSNAPVAATITTPAVAGSITSPAKQNPPSHTQHSQHTSSPTPLAFTPTSVLRKMTAEKETDNNSASINPNVNIVNNQPQQSDRPLNPNILLGLNNPLSQQQQQQQRNLSALIGQHPPHQPPPPQQGPPPQIPHHHLGAGHHPNASQMSHQQQPAPVPQQQPNSQQMRGGQHQPPGMPGGNIHWNLKQPHPGQQMPKPQGRPILKGGNTQQQPPQQQSQPQHPLPMSQMSFASNLEFQQQMQQFQQNRSGNPILGAHQSQNPQQPQPPQQTPAHNQHQNQMNPHLHQLLQQRQQQQQQQRAIRNQHMQQMPGSFRMGQHQQSGPGQHPHQGQPQSQPQSGAGIINYTRDGGLSPTSNQLARWFSPELLAQASAGKLPSLNIGQAMSLEEFERNMQHSSATVHN